MVYGACCMMYCTWSADALVTSSFVSMSHSQHSSRTCSLLLAAASSAGLGALGRMAPYSSTPRPLSSSVTSSASRLYL
jgi:hypothetical protein